MMTAGYFQYDERFLLSSASPAVPENSPKDFVEFSNIDAYDERFLSSSVVTCGVENSACRLS